MSQSRLPSSRKLPARQVVVAEDDRQRHLLRLERVGDRQVTRQLAVAAAAGGLQRPRVVADDVKDPERVCRTREMARGSSR